MKIKKYILMGIGNQLRDDDGIGNFIAKNFQDPEWLSLDCEMVPENFTSLVKKVKPELLVLLDGVEMDLPPGEIRIIDPDKIQLMHLTTHYMPLSFLISYLEKFTKEVIFLGIQPKTIDYSPSLSPEVLKSRQKIMQVLKNRDFRSIKKL